LRVLQKVVFLAFGLLVAGSSLAEQEVLTNLDLLKEAVKEALLVTTDRLLEEGTPHNGTVVIRSASDHKANWLVEHSLLDDLVARGLRVRVEEDVAPDSASVELSYRILDMGVEYPAQGRYHGVGRLWVERRATVKLSFQLTDGITQEVKWIQESEASRGGRFPYNRLATIESKSYPFTKAKFEKKSWTRYLEPVIVSGVVGGLIYLFYSHR
jgi:hypothetical protein